MVPRPQDTARPPRLLRALARLLIRGDDAPYILSDLDVSFAHDVERGHGRVRRTRRYVWNVLASAWAVWTAALASSVTHGIGLDAKLGLRMLAKQRLITAVAVLALGLGIPASLIMVHGIDVFFSDLPVPEGHRVVGVRHYDVDRQNALPSSMHDLERWQALESLQSLGAVRSYTVNVDGEESGAAPVSAAEMTASAFEILRARPLLGRVLRAEDELGGAPDVAVIGEDMWRARFGRDPDIIGQSIRIGSTPHTVVGVMPEDFRFPSSDQVWLPLRARAVDLPVGGGPRVLVFGRLADGVSLDEAQVEMAGLTERRASDDPERFERLVGEVVGMATLLLNEDADDSAFWSQSELVLFQALAFGLLLVVCGNVGTLILARTAARSSEIAIRTALGASRGRILTQLFVEAFVLVMTATAVGLFGANAFAAWLMRLLEPYGVLPYWVDLTLTPRIVGMALGLAALCAIVAGIVPALPATRRGIQASIQRAASGRSAVRFGLGSSLLIVSQIVLSVGFLALGATRARSAFLYGGEGLGFDPDRYVVATLTVPGLDPAEVGGPSDTVEWRRGVAEVQEALRTRLSADPSVRGVAMGADVPGLEPPNRTVVLETPPVGFEPVDWDTAVPYVDVSFFSGLDRPILAGRDFHADDVARDLTHYGPLSPEQVNDGLPGTRRDAVIVNESFVRHVLGGRSAVGQRLRYAEQGASVGDPAQKQWYEIVGVVGRFGTNPHNSARDAAIYHPVAPGELNPIHYTIEVAGDPETFPAQLRRIAAEVDPRATVSADLLSARIETNSMIARSIHLLEMAMAGAAFLLSVTGLYALLSLTVSQRTREIGIRSALGAKPGDIVAAVGRGAAIQVGIGLALGVGLGWMLLDVSRSDVRVEVGSIPLTLALTALASGIVCVLAAARPMMRGLRIQPTEALKES